MCIQKDIEETYCSSKNLSKMKKINGQKCCFPIELFVLMNSKTFRKV